MYKTPATMLQWPCAGVVTPHSVLLARGPNGLVMRTGNWLRAIGRTFGWAVGWLVVAAIRAYQVAISPLLVGSCKFVPSCSQYCVMAVRQYGPWYGSWLGVRRVLRCNPFSAGGYDPVPGRATGSDAPRGRKSER
jgi:putative membrane protein insertion efficiency factor